MKKHNYTVTTIWDGNLGEGTTNYKAYSRNHTIVAEHKKHVILSSSDPSFLGDKTHYNPEELFVSSVSSCHMLWYLHLCTMHHIIVTSYKDEAKGIMEEHPKGSGQFTAITLFPVVEIHDEKLIAKAIALHEKANEMCFIANSCNFKIHHQPKVLVKK